MWYYVLTLFILLSNHGVVLSQSYKAAVIEYNPQKQDTPQNTILKNLDTYRSFADTSRAQSVDIVVFPEYGLTTVVPNPEEYAIEINNDDRVIKELSAIAKERQIYLVVNLLEKNLTNGQSRYYSTDLVFDRNGKIITTYRKINLYNETKLTPGPYDQNQIFTTDFGVTFGIFTGMDILFSNPSRKILERRSVTDVVFPTAWVSKMPFYMSLSVQYGYAISNGVNLLAANYDTPRDGRGGSGIYLADGKIAETYIADSSSSKPIVQTVPKITSRESTSTCTTLSAFGLPGDSAKSNVSDYFTTKVFESSRYEFESVDLAVNESSTTVCGEDKEFCCTFDIQVVNASRSFSGVYKVLAFDGEVVVDEVKAHVRTCALVACETNSLDTCGARVNTTTRFKKITVRGNLPTDDSAFYIPLTLNTFLLPSKTVKFCDTNNGTNSSYVQLTSIQAQRDLLVFGLFGTTNIPVKPKNDDNNNDDNDPGAGSAISVIQNSFRFLILLVLLKTVFV